MQTAQQLREAAQSQRMRAYAAPNMEMQRLELIEAERLEKQASELEAKPSADDDKRLRVQLSLKDEQIRRLTDRVAWLEAIIGNQIGRPVDGMSNTKLAFTLEEVRVQRQRLADGISKASTLADLQHMKNVARNMGLIERRNQYERLAACLGQG
ncbi:hypothetical protein V2S84_17540 [Azotobacter chroococcum]|nr:hypothetical protein [Azotobacter chroococcum]